MEKQTNAAKRLFRYPYYMGLLVLAVFVVAAQIFAVVDSLRPVLTYTTDAVGAVMSTCSEVLAGLYGITLTGYIFFADRFQNTSREDESLYDAVQALLLRYNHMAGIISLMCMVCIVLGEGLVLYGDNTLLPPRIYRFWVNEALLLFFCTFDFILYFVISVLDPQKVDRMSREKKAKLSEDKTAGDPAEFIAAWLRCEEQINALYDELLQRVRFVPGGGKNKPAVVHKLETLRNYSSISLGLWRRLDTLRQYHSLTLHDPQMTVSAEMCTLAQEAAAELETKKH